MSAKLKFPLLLGVTVLFCLVVLVERSTSLCIPQEEGKKEEEEKVKDNVRRDVLAKEQKVITSKAEAEALLIDTGTNGGFEPIDMVGQFLMNSYSALPSNVTDLVLEMDIIKTPVVEEIILRGIVNDDNKDGSSNRTVPGGRNRRGKRGTATDITLWPNNTIPYQFSPLIPVSVQVLVIKAMNVWMLHTCIKFRPRLPGEENYLHILQGLGCKTYIGMVGGAQALYLSHSGDWYCRTVGVILHELGHAIGFWHEHTRPDRDDYVYVNMDNVLPSERDQFRKYGRSTYFETGVPYDYQSIMHYPKKFFSINNQNTITPKDPSVVEMGQRYALSPSDILQANLLYSCTYLRLPYQPPAAVEPPQVGPLFRSDHVIMTTPSPLASNEVTSFLLKNRATSTCLTIPTMRNKTAISRHSHRALYLLVLKTCNVSSPIQHWEWTRRGSLLHKATFLCLAKFDNYGKTALVLRTCKDNDNDQKVVCEEDTVRFDNKTCLATEVVIPTINSVGGDDNTVAAGGHQPSMETLSLQKVGIIQELTSELEKVAKGSSDANDMTSRDKNAEISMFDPTVHVDSNDEAKTSTSTSTENQLPRIEPCRNQDTHHQWTGVDDIGGGEASENGPICERYHTENPHSLHRPRCYALDMENASRVYEYNPEWTLCGGGSGGDSSDVGYYVNGFFHTYNKNRNNWRENGLLSGINCCTGYHYSSSSGGSNSASSASSYPPLDNFTEVCYDIEWWHFRPFLVTRGWFTCPRGTFLKGFYLSSREFIPEENLVISARCCKPEVAAEEYLHCYVDLATSVADTMEHVCTREGYHIAGIFRKNCDVEDHRGCKEEITCCMKV